MWQTVVNAAARLTAGAQKYDYVTPLQKDLHLLWVPERITYIQAVRSDVSTA